MRSAPTASASGITSPAAAPLALPAQAASPRPVTPGNAQQAGLLALLEIETVVRGCRKEEQLHLVMTHETQKIVRCRQCFLLLAGRSSGMQMASISGLSMVDRTVPLVRDIERAIETILKQDSDRGVRTVQLAGSATAPSQGSTLGAYAFASMLWVPLTGADDRRLGGLLLARETPWTEADERVCGRLAEPYAYALEALRRKPAVDRRALRSWRITAAMTILAAGALAIPVPMTALAPFEMAARDPAIVTTGADGVIETVEIDPNTPVRPGQLLARLADINARNRLELAEREVLVADAKIKKWQQMSFGDPRANHELAIASAELRLKAAERDWAREQLSLSEVKAARPGIAVFLDKKDLIGKPVAVGEKIMEIADPARVEARVDLAVADVLILQTGARAKLFLDSDPLHAREARVGQADYQARVRPNNTLSLRVVAHLAGEEMEVPRIGARGMAQIFGEKVPLGYYLFRRPISALRQWFGL
jgi:HlyD family secretion protein